MMCRYIKWCISITVVLLSACNPAKKNAFKYERPGYWYKLLAFENESHKIEKGSVAKVAAVFKTLHDSIFFDTHNDLKDLFFIHVDTAVTGNFLNRSVSYAAEGDSACLLIKPADFFDQQFKNKVPWFCEKDSVVKVFFKVTKIFSASEYAAVLYNIENHEQEEIERFFGSPGRFEMAKDSLGFYWVEPPTGTGTVTAIAGDAITLSYEGGFLNGRIIDTSPKDFQVIYGTPDQLLKGLNYVIGRLKKGQTSKIILPSRLAFGENGSSNGSVPPFTPMLYKITIIDIKTPGADI
jgi:FKBP-type peptidyl-prolyl cis-trans isomerase 2